MKPDIKQPSKLMPHPPRELLIAAAKVQGDFDRQKAIDEAVRKIRREYPEFFKESLE